MFLFGKKAAKAKSPGRSNDEALRVYVPEGHVAVHILDAQEGHPILTKVAALPASGRAPQVKWEGEWMTAEKHPTWGWAYRIPAPVEA